MTGIDHESLFNGVFMSMGIAGSMVDDHCFPEYLGMRHDYVDMN